jgi:hypothetical protein
MTKETAAPGCVEFVSQFRKQYPLVSGTFKNARNIYVFSAHATHTVRKKSNHHIIIYNSK